MSDQLPDTNNLPGGLFVRRDRPKNLNGQQPQQGGSSSSSNPMASRLGLDRLAAEKAAERAAAAASAPLMPPPPKRPMLSHLHDDHGDEGGDSSHEKKRYRRPREETPSHAGGVNVASAQRIKERVAERLKGAGQVFTTAAPASDADASANPQPSTGGTAATRQWEAAASPALSSAGASEWEAPSPRHPPLVPDRAQFGSEPRGFAADTPLDTPQGRTGSMGGGASASVSRSGGGATPLHPGAFPKGASGGTYQLAGLGGGGGGETDWEKGSVAGDVDVQADAAAEDDKLDRDWCMSTRSL